MHHLAGIVEDVLPTHNEPEDGPRSHGPQPASDEHIRHKDSNAANATTILLGDEYMSRRRCSRRRKGTERLGRMLVSYFEEYCRFIDLPHEACIVVDDINIYFTLVLAGSCSAAPHRLT